MLYQTGLTATELRGLCLIHDNSAEYRVRAGSGIHREGKMVQLILLICLLFPLMKPI